MEIRSDDFLNTAKLRNENQFYVKFDAKSWGKFFELLKTLKWKFCGLKKYLKDIAVKLLWNGKLTKYSQKWFDVLDFYNRYFQNLKEVILCKYNKKRQRKKIWN